MLSLLVLGVSLGISGLFLIVGLKGDEGMSDQVLDAKGGYSEVADSGALDVYAPWMILIAGISLFGSYILKEK